MKTAVFVGSIMLLSVGVIVFLFALLLRVDPSCGSLRQDLVEAKGARIEARRTGDESGGAEVAERARAARAAGCDVSDLIDDSVGA